MVHNFKVDDEAVLTQPIGSFIPGHNEDYLTAGSVVTIISVQSDMHTVGVRLLGEEENGRIFYPDVTFLMPYEDALALAFHGKETLTGTEQQQPQPDDDSGEQPFVVAELHKAADLHLSRNAEYGDSYMQAGEYWHALMRGQAVTVQSPAEWARLVNLILLAGKLHRYAANFTKGGHPDSLRDMSVYAMMQLRLDTEL